MCALLGVGQCLVVGFLLESDTLCSNTQTGTVHQAHHIFDQTQLAIAAELSLGILVDELTGRRAVDTELILDVSHVDAAVALIVDKH